MPILADADGKHSKEKAGLLAKTILVEGVVQRVGFRRFVESTARRFHITGFVKNLKDGAVQIFAQSSQANSLDDFIKEIESNAPKPIQIDKLEINEAKPRPSFKRFVLKTGPLIEEMIEGFGSMESQFRDYREEFRDYRAEFKDYRAEFRGFAKQTNESFSSLDNKYGEISQKLT